MQSTPALFRARGLRASLVTALIATLAAPGFAAAVVDLATAPTGAVRGTLRDLDGLPARGHQVLLIDERGDVRARSEVDAGGAYRFASVEPGDYGFGIVTPAGRHAAVFDHRAAVRPGATVERDIRLLATEGDDTGSDPASGGDSDDTHNGLVLWWVGLSTPAKVVTVVGVVVGGVILYDALDDDDDDEPAASPSGPST